MVADVMLMFMNMFSNLWNLVDRIFTQLGAWSYFLGAFIIFTLFRLVLKPIIGASVGIGASDTVRNFKKDKASNSSSSKKNS